MSIIRAPRRTSFTVVDNRMVDDASLSFVALGILTWLVRKPDNWRTDADAIARARREGRDVVARAQREMEAAGYLRRYRWQESGRWVSASWVFERPEDADAFVPPAGAIPQKRQKPSPDHGFPGSGAPGSGRPESGTSGSFTRTENNNGEQDSPHPRTCSAAPQPRVPGGVRYPIGSVAAAEQAWRAKRGVGDERAD